jgi:hypothetical protein
MPALASKRFDVRSRRFRNTRPVQCEETQQRVVLWLPEARGDEHGSDLIAIEPCGMGLVVESRAPHVGGGRLGDQVFLFRVAVETGDGASRREIVERARPSASSRRPKPSMSTRRAPKSEIRRSAHHSTY